MIRRAGAALVLCAASSSCFYVPPITPVPAERDTPPFLLGFEPEMTIDLSAASDARFSVDAVYDLNDTEQIDWEFRLFPGLVDRSRAFTIDSGELRRREVQSFDDATEYEGPELVLPACPTLENAAGDGDVVSMELVLIDPLPEPQVREGFEAYEVTFVWNVRLSGECPQ